MPTTTLLTGTLRPAEGARFHAAVPPAAANGQQAPWLLVIQHHEARIYRSTAAGASAQLIRPHVPADFFQPAPKANGFSRGQEQRAANRFFEPAAGVLKGAGSILILGGGTGTAGEMDQFVAWTKLHRPEVAMRIIGLVVVDEHHLTEARLLAKARSFHASLRGAAG